MNNIKTPFYSSVSKVKVKFAVISSVLWLCALSSWIYFCPQYLPSTDYLLFSNFDSVPNKDVKTGQIAIEPFILIRHMLFIKIF